MKKWKGLLLMLAIIWSILMQPGTQVVEAASKNIRIDEFVEYIVKQMEWQIDEESERPYIEVAMKKGILKKGEFKDYTAYLTRTDAAVIADRLDESINLKYGYTDDVYEFLSGCKLFEGRLFYDIKGNYFPEGETDQTYMGQNFSNDVAALLLEKAFPNDSWVKQGLRTRYRDIYDKEGNIINTFIMIGATPIESDNVVGIDPFKENSEIIQAWNVIKDSDRMVDFVLDKRISDINVIQKNKKEAVASIVAKGIIKGYSNGMYVQNREFRGNNIITNKGAKDVIQKVINPDLRALISPDGQLIRTRKLPKNADEYAYILECFPNEYYEMDYSFMFLNSFKEGKYYGQYAYPKDVDYKFLYDNYYEYQINHEIDKYELFDIALKKVEKYIQHIFNVDYRTVDDKWKDGLESSFTQGFFDWRIKEWIDEYVKKMKKNHVVVEYQHIAIDTGTIYDSVGNLYVRVYVKYKITADTINASSDELLYGNSTNLINLENNKWRDGYYDIQINTNYCKGGYQWGIDTLYGVNDGW